ncbi:MAG: nitroreductase family protein [Nitrospirota bacterium]
MDVLEALAERRSINFFEAGETLSDNLLKELINIANLSPSSFNLQPWRVIMVKDPERKKVLRRCAFDQPKVEEAPAVLIMIADPAGVEDNLERVLDSWQNLGYIRQDMRETYMNMTKTLYGTPESLQRKIFAVKNTALFAMNLMIAAKGLGLDTHPMDGFDENCIKKEFKIPDDMIIPMLIAVGHLKKGIALRPRAFRRPLEEFVIFE